MRRLLAGLTCLAAPAAAFAAGGIHRLQDPAFTTTVPGGWHERTVHRHGHRIYFFNSGSGHASNLGLPPRGQIGLTIGVRRVARGTTARHAVGTDVGYPRGAKGVTGTAVRRTRLAGARAATITLEYRYKGVRWVQSDLVAIHGTTLAFLEVDAGPAKARRGRSVLAAVRRSWRWR